MGDKRGGNLLKKKSFWTRTISGIILALILVLVFCLGYGVMWAFVLVLSLLGQFELYRAIGLSWGPLTIFSYAANIVYYVVLLIWGISSYIILDIAVLMIVYLAVFVLTYPKYELMQLFGAMFGVIYIGVCLSFLYLIRIIPPYGAFIVWLVVISSWGCDIFAYLFGMLFGKHQLVPKLSPNKSVEGSIGGIIGAVILGFVFALATSKWTQGISLPWLIFPLLCFFGAIAGQIGDLAASAVKRKVGIKDYSNLIPGHGGVMDRFDSVIMVAPIIYVITIWIHVMH